MKYLELLEQIHVAVCLQKSAVDLRQAVFDLMLAEASQQISKCESIMVTQQHPLGFFACRWSLGSERTLRLHLWSSDFDWSQEPGWDIHDHIFSFSSCVLFGMLENSIYEIDESSVRAGPEHSVFKVVYSGEKSSMLQVERGVYLKKPMSSIESDGMFYSMEAGVLHSSKLLSRQAATVLATRTDGIPLNGPRVVSTHQVDSVTFDRTPKQLLLIPELLLKFSKYLKIAN